MVGPLTHHYPPHAPVQLVVHLCVRRGGIYECSAWFNLVARDDNLPARVPYVFPALGTNQIADAIRARRDNGTLLDLDGALLNAPLNAQSWNDIAGVVRDNNTIPADMRELMILRTAVLSNSAYIWLQHESVGRAAGLTTNDLLTLRMAPPMVGLGAINSSAARTLNSTLSPALGAAVDFADCSTQTVRIPQAVYDRLHKLLTHKQMVEAMITVGFYNLVSRFVVGLNVDDKMNVPVPIPK